MQRYLDEFVFRWNRRRHLRHEAPPGFDILEVPAAAQQQGLLQPRLQMAVAAFDGAVLVGHPAIVAGGLHAIVVAQGLLTRAQILAPVAVQVGKGGREAVGAMLARRTAELS